MRSQPNQDGIRDLDYQSHLLRSFISLLIHAISPAFRSDFGEIKTLHEIRAGLFNEKLTGYFRRSRAVRAVSMAPMSLRQRYADREVNGRMPDIAQ